MDDRRVADEAFRRELAERMKAVEIEVRESRNEVKEVRGELLAMKMSQMDLHYTLFGGPKQDDVGLLEKFRKLLYRFGIALLILVGILSFAGKLISPLYNKAVTQWFYNSVSERWMREQQRPKVKVYKIYRKNDDVD